MWFLDFTNCVCKGNVGQESEEILGVELSKLARYNSLEKSLDDLSVISERERGFRLDVEDCGMNVYSHEWTVLLSISVLRLMVLDRGLVGLTDEHETQDFALSASSMLLCEQLTLEKYRCR